MAGKLYELEFKMTDGTKQKVQFEAPQGPQGPQGPAYTFTEADKAEIVAMVISEIGTPIAGTVNENNEIILGGDLADGNYTVKWVANGEYAQIATIAFENGSIVDPDEPPTEEFKNWINFGTTELGGTEIYNGKGWKENTRWSASGNAPATRDGMYLTGIIAVEGGDIIYTYGMPWLSSLSETAYFARYYSNGSIDEVDLTSAYTNGSLAPDEKGVYSFEVPSGVTGVRFSCFGIDDTSMITVNKYPK